MTTTRPKRLERLAEGLLVLAILAVTGATWLPALIGADPDPMTPVTRERAAALKREQELRRTRGPRATPVVPGRAVPVPGLRAQPAQDPPIDPSLTIPGAAAEPTNE